MNRTHLNLGNTEKFSPSPPEGPLGFDPGNSLGKVLCLTVYPLYRPITDTV